MIRWHSILVVCQAPDQTDHSHPEPRMFKREGLAAICFTNP